MCLKSTRKLSKDKWLQIKFVSQKIQVLSHGVHDSNFNQGLAFIFSKTIFNNITWF